MNCRSKSIFIICLMITLVSPPAVGGENGSDPAVPPLPDDPKELPDDLFRIIVARRRKKPPCHTLSGIIEAYEGWLVKNSDSPYRLSILESVYYLMTDSREKYKTEEEKTIWLAKRTNLFDQMLMASEPYAPIQRWRWDDYDFERLYAYTAYCLKVKQEDEHKPVYPYQTSGALVHPRQYQGDYKYRPHAYEGRPVNNRTKHDWQLFTERARDFAIMNLLDEHEHSRLTANGRYFNGEEEMIEYYTRLLTDFADVAEMVPIVRDRLLRLKRRKAGQNKP